MHKTLSKKFAVLVLISVIALCGCSNKKTVSNQSFLPTDFSKVDFDFSVMNYNMVSSALFEVLVEPEKYKNKTVKITGQFNSQEYEGVRYYTAVIWDSTGCCPTGLDFIPPAGMTYPQDFPNDNEEITVYGTMTPKVINGEEQLFFMAEKIAKTSDLH